MKKRRKLEPAERLRRFIRRLCIAKWASGVATLAVAGLWISSCDKDKLYFNPLPSVAFDLLTCNGIIYLEINHCRTGPIVQSAPGVFLPRAWLSFYEHYARDLDEYCDPFPSPWRFDVYSGARWQSLAVAIPFWLPFVISLSALIVFSGLHESYAAFPSLKPPHYLCHCGYNLTGNTSGVCPECGNPTTKAHAPTDRPDPK